MNNLQDVLLATAQTSDKGFYFIDGSNEKYCSYQEFLQRSLSVLALLQENDIHPGETLAIQTIKPEATLLLIWACILGDIIPAPCAIDYSRRQLNFLELVANTIKNVHFIFNKPYNSYLKKIADNSESSFLNKNAMAITEEDVLAAAYDHHLPLNLNSYSSDQRIMLFSSGTTGEPKGIIYSDDNLCTDLLTISQSVDVSRQDSFLNWLPLNHILGLSLHFIALFYEMDQYILPANIFLQKPSIWLELIAKYKVTISASPNFGYKLCLQNEISADSDLSCLRLLIMGAEPTSLDLINKFTDKFSQNGFSKKMISCGYGLTETQLVSLSAVGQPLNEVYIQKNQTAIGSKVAFVAQQTADSLGCLAQGKPFTAFELSIRDDAGNKLPEGYIGLIHLAGPSIASNYVTSTGVRTICESDGSFNTLDIGFMYQGQLYITGRKKEMIIANGENFFLQDLDTFLASIPELQSSSLASVNFNYDDQDHVVVLVEDKDLLVDSQKKLEKIIYSQTARQFKIEISEVLVVPQILKTATGKIMRKANCDLYLAKGGGGED